MWLIRRFEERVATLFAMAEIPGLVHLSIGQEAVAVALASVLRPSDRVFGGHRAHAHALARGADPVGLLAEIVGRAGGINGGKAGSMHISVPEVGFVTATGVVAGNVPLALGAALASQMRGDGSVAVAIFGDGAGQAGIFHESLNLASLWGLPVIFVCENNGYAEFSPLSAHTRVERLSRHAATYGIEGVIVDGNDLGALMTAFAEAVERSRAGGPSFVECLTIRARGHYEGDPERYRDPAEEQRWLENEPIGRFVRTMAGAGVESSRLDDAARSAATARIEAATEQVLAMPWPDSSSLLQHVYAG
jgi:pyruvate dehydrogenase E1 component alpha subunit